MSIVYIAATILLWFFAYIALGEYNPSSFETIGITMVVVCTAVGSAAMLFSLYGILKWKSDQTPEIPRSNSQ